MSNPNDGAVVEVPDGRIASVEDMRLYGRAIQHFVRETESRLPAIADATEHNRIVDFLHVLAGTYNEQLKLFRAAEEQRVRHLQLLLVALLADTVERDDRLRCHGEFMPGS